MDDDVVTTNVALTKRTWNLLAELARLRAERLGGRPSQSAVVRDMIEAEAKLKLREKHARS